MCVEGGGLGGGVCVCVCGGGGILLICLGFETNGPLKI